MADKHPDQAAQVKNWANQALGIAINSPQITTYFNTMRPTDVGIVPYAQIFNANIPNMTQGVVSQAFTASQPTTDATGHAIAGGIPSLPLLDAKCTIVGYDPEHWDKTPKDEQDNLVATVQTFSSDVRSTGRLFFCIPDALFNTQLGAQLAPLVDIMGIQAGHKQYTPAGVADPAGWASYMNTTARAIKTANPQVRLWIQWVTSSTKDGTMPSQLLDYINRLTFGMSILGIFGTGQDVAAVEQCVSILRPAG